MHMSSLSLNLGGFQTRVDRVTVFETLGACREENPFCLKNLSLDDTLWRFSFPLKLLNRESCFSNFRASTFVRGGNKLSEQIRSVMLVVGVSPLADLGSWAPTWISIFWWSLTLTTFYSLSDVWRTVLGGNWGVISDRSLDKRNLKIMLQNEGLPVVATLSRVRAPPALGQKACIHTKLFFKKSELGVLRWMRKDPCVEFACSSCCNGSSGRWECGLTEKACFLLPSPSVSLGANPTAAICAYWEEIIQISLSFIVSTRVSSPPQKKSSFTPQCLFHTLWLKILFILISLLCPCSDDPEIVLLAGTLKMHIRVVHAKIIETVL